MSKLTAFIEHELEDMNQVYSWYNERIADIVEIPVIPEGYVPVSLSTQLN